MEAFESNFVTDNRSVEPMEIEEIIESFQKMEIKDEKESIEWIYVDVQGFKVNKNRFMCKEFCLISDDEIFHSIVKPWFPYKKLLSLYKRQVEYLTNSFHGIKYEDGNINIVQLTGHIYPKLMGKNIIVKGAEKVIWLKKIFERCGAINCTNIEDFNIEVDKQQNDDYGYYNNMCDYHMNTYGWRQCRCAKSNALILQKAFQKHLSKN